MAEWTGDWTTPSDGEWFSFCVPYTEAMELDKWLSEPDRKGRFSFQYRSSDYRTYFVTDPDVAFELKIRWG